MPIIANLPINDVWYTGDSHQIEINLTEEGELLILTDYDIVFTAKMKKDDADNAPTTIQKTLGNGIELIDGPEGEPDGGMLITFESSDTKNLDETTTYFWDVQISLDEEVITVAAGTIKFEKDITQI